MDVMVDVKTLRYSVICVSFSLVFICLSAVFICFSTFSFMLASSVSYMVRKCSSDLLSIFLPPFGILNLEILIVVLYGTDER